MPGKNGVLRSCLSLCHTRFSDCLFVWRRLSFSVIRQPNSGWKTCFTTPEFSSPALKFTPFYNPGFFFGFWHPEYLKVLTVVLSCLVIYVTIDLLKKNRKNQGLLITGVGLIWGGMLGNLADRLISGYVFDFIALWRIPVFNLADTALTLGAAAIMVNLFLRKMD